LFDLILIVDFLCFGRFLEAGHHNVHRCMLQDLQLDDRTLANCDCQKIVQLFHDSINFQEVANSNEWHMFSPWSEKRHCSNSHSKRNCYCVKRHDEVATEVEKMDGKTVSNWWKTKERVWNFQTKREVFWSPLAAATGLMSAVGGRPESTWPNASRQRDGSVVHRSVRSGCCGTLARAQAAKSERPPIGVVTRSDPRWTSSQANGDVEWPLRCGGNGTCSKRFTMKSK
jgi:hypothetical protein